MARPDAFAPRCAPFQFFDFAVITASKGDFCVIADVIKFILRYRSQFVISRVQRVVYDVDGKFVLPNIPADVIGQELGFDGGGGERGDRRRRDGFAFQ